MKKSLCGFFSYKSLLFIAFCFIPFSVNARSLPDFTQLVKDYGGAVVNISTTQKSKIGGRYLPKGWNVPNLPKGHPFEEFFEHFFDGQGRGQGRGGSGKQKSVPKSLGSGFIISKDGYILTNNHVVEGADEIIVSLDDRREINAKVIGTDPKTDVALIKIEADDLDVVKIGNSSKLEVGEWVLAIGSPFGFDRSVTAGIVSAKERNLPNGNYVPFIQTDVAINPGNSGGPLFNLDGKVVGINAQIFTRTGSYSGLSFAIPIDLAMDIANQLMDSGKVSRGWLGVMIQEVDKNLADSFGLDKPFGAVVLDVVEGSPAEKAGIEIGDVIIEYNSKEVERSSSLPPLVGATRVGEEVEVVVIRNGEKESLNVVIAELENDKQAKNEGGSSLQKSSTNKLGISVREINDQEKDRLSLKGEGVFVESVEEGPALDAGLREGDFIKMIDGKVVDSVDGFENLISEIDENSSVSVLIHRRGRPIFLAIKIN